MNADEQKTPTSGNGKGVAWTAIIFSLIALTVSFYVLWVNARIDSRIEEVGSEIAAETRLFIARTEAAVRITVLRARLAGEETYTGAVDDLHAVESELEQAYASVERTSSEEWQDIVTLFNNTESAIRQGADNALDVLDTLIDTLRANG